MVFPRKKNHINCLCSAEESDLKTNIQVTLEELKRQYSGIYVCAHAHAITISERRGHEFEGEHVRVYERI